MKMKYLVVAGSLMLSAALPLPAMAQAAAALSDIVVEAPKDLNDAQARQWNKLNKQAQKYAREMNRLETEMRDDEDDVAEAHRDLEKAQKHLASEQKDYDKTATRIAKLKNNIEKLGQKRASIKIATR